MDKTDPLRQLWLAFVLLTRLPLPHLPAHMFAQGARAVWAYPLVGLGVGLIGAGAGLLAGALGLPALAAAALALGAMMLTTGAMHEDGLADVFDGFWGGFTPARRLEIMRDSQIGTYGVLALVLLTLLRLSALTVLLAGGLAGGWAAILAAAALSRAYMPALMHALPPARADGLSRSVGRPALPPVLLALCLGVLAGALAGGAAGLLAGALGAMICAMMGALARTKIGGQTGDVLGATQQISEAAILLCLAAQMT